MRKKQSIYVNARFLTQPLTGVQQFAIEVSLVLKKSHPDWIWLSPKNILHKEVAGRLDVKTIGPFGGQKWEQITLAAYIRRHGGRLVNFGNTAPLLVKSAIVTIHDVGFMSHPEWYSPSFSLFYRYVVPRVAGRCHHILTVSAFSKSEIIRYFKVPSEKIHVVPNGISTALASAALKKPDALAPDTSYVLTVGTFSQRKNLKALIEAFSAVDCSEKLVVVGGTGGLYAQEKGMENLMQSGRIVVLSNLEYSELAWLYSHARLFVYPSLYEGFGIPVLEALYFGCPVLANNLEVFKALFGEHIQYVEAGNRDHLRNAIQNALAVDNLTSEVSDSSLLFDTFDFSKAANTVSKIIENSRI